MIEKKLIDGLEKELKLSQDKLEVIIFGYRLFIYSFWGFFFIILLAYLLGTLQATLIATLTASTFRVFSGGAHASSQRRCVVIGALIFNILGLLATTSYKYLSFYSLNWIFGITAIIALIIFIIYAPADTPGKPITTKVQRDKLKGISIGLLIFWLIFCKFAFKGETNIHKLHLLASTLGLAWQSISLLPITYGWIIFK